MKNKKTYHKPLLALLVLALFGQGCEKASDDEISTLKTKVANVSSAPNITVSTVAEVDSKDHLADVAFNLVDSSIYLASNFSFQGIYKRDSKGMISKFVGSCNNNLSDGVGSAAGLGGGITALSINSSGVLYVTEGGIGRIRKVTPDAVVSTIAFDNANMKGSFQNVLLADGSLLVTVNDRHQIVKVKPDGTITAFAGSGQQGNSDGTVLTAKFWNPVGLVQDNDGTIYVSDDGNSNIRKISPDGNVTTLAGGGEFGFADGVGTTVKFWQIGLMALSPDGYLYVVDRANYRIRRVSKSTGEVITIAGSEYGDKDGSGTEAKFGFINGIKYFDGALYVTDENKLKKISFN